MICGALKAKFVPFTAQTRMSGVNLAAATFAKGAVDAITSYLGDKVGNAPRRSRDSVEKIARMGGTPLVVAENRPGLGVIYLKDIVKGGIEGALRPSCAPWASAPS